MDPLSDVFHLLKVDSVLSARLEAYGAWSLRFSGYEHTSSVASWKVLSGYGSKMAPRRSN